MPVFEHGDFRLYETQAILRYIDRVLPDPPLAPADPVDAARMDQMLGIVDWYLFEGCANVIGFERVVKRLFGGGDPDEGAIAAVMPRAHAVVAELSRLLSPATRCRSPIDGAQDHDSDRRLIRAA